MKRLRNTVAVMLAGVRDFGRCPIGTELPRAFWRLLDRPIIAYQLEQLARQGIMRATVCVDDEAKDRQDALRVEGMTVRLLSDRMPRGPAGCVKDALGQDDAGPALVVEGGVAWLPDAGELLSLHRSGAAELTIFTSSEPAGPPGAASAAGVYVCERRALDLVADSGYQDIKEQLIPALLKAGRPVRAVPAPGEIIAGRDLNAYLRVAACAVTHPERFGFDFALFEKRGDGVLVHRDARVDESARIAGPAVVLEGAQVAARAVVIGPSVVGRRATVGEGALVDASVLWQDAVVGRGAFVSQSLLADGAQTAPGRSVTGRSVVARRRRKVTQSGRRTEEARPGEEEPREPPAAGGDRARVYLAAALAVALGLAWAYAEVWRDLWRVWMNNDTYSSGVLVPFIAAYVLALRRKELAKIRLRPCYWGVGIILLGFAMRFAGSILFFASAQRFSLVMVIWGTVLLLFGTKLVRRSMWVLAFLLLMLPWPNRLYQAVSLPLQSWATTSSVFLLELFGWPVLREGNVIQIGSTTVAVEEACSGLRMLTAFMVVAGLVALLSRRTFWEKAVVFASSVPIAIACNTVRLTVTAIAFTQGSGQMMNKFFHDLGGFAMMPLALGILLGELWLLARLVVVGPVGSLQACRSRR